MRHTSTSVELFDTTVDDGKTALTQRMPIPPTSRMRMTGFAQMVTTPTPTGARRAELVADSRRIPRASRDHGVYGQVKGKESRRRKQITPAVYVRVILRDRRKKGVKASDFVRKRLDGVCRADKGTQTDTWDRKVSDTCDESDERYGYLSSRTTWAAWLT